jgi:multidrug efflux pump subunit AcrB
VDDLKVLKEEARRIERELRNVEGISRVQLSGFPSEEIEIRLRQDRLSEMNLSIQEVAASVRSSNLETTGGRLKLSDEEMIIRGRYRTYEAQGLEDIVVRADRDGRVVRVGDVAIIEDRWAENDPSRNWFNGQPAAVITVNNLNSESILDIAEDVRSYIAAYNRRGDATRLEVIRDSSLVLNQRILFGSFVLGFVPQCSGRFLGGVGHSCILHGHVPSRCSFGRNDQRDFLVWNDLGHWNPCG